MTAFTQQVGGSHYKDMIIQPAEYIHKNHIGFMEGAAIKYLSRWRSKGGIQDLEKAKHMINLLIEMEMETQAMMEQEEQRRQWDDDRMDVIGQNGNEGDHYLHWSEQQ